MAKQPYRFEPKADWHKKWDGKEFVPENPQTEVKENEVSPGNSETKE